MRRQANFAALVVMLVVMLAFGSIVAAADEIPSPDLTVAQPQVREKLLAARARVEDAPDRAETWGRYGMVLHAHSCLTEAARAYAVARRLAPGEFRWPYFQAIVTQKTNPRLAFELLEAARAIDPDYVPALIHLGRLQETLGDSEAAERSYTRAVSLDPDSCPALLHQGKLALQRGEMPVAVSALEAAARLAPEDRAVLATLARVYQRAGRGAEARAVAERARTAAGQTPFSDPLYAEVRWEAVNIRAFQQRATALRDKGDYAGARAELQRAEAFAPEDPSVQASLAEVHWREGNLLGAVAAGRRALASGMRFEDLHQIMAIVYFGLDEFEEADRHAVLALRETPNDPDLHLIRGETLTRRGEIDAAIDHLERAIEGKPDDGHGRFRLGQLLARSGRYDEAVVHLTHLAEANPRDVETLALLGLTHLRRAAYDEAEATLAAASALAPGNPGLVRAHAAALIGARRFREAAVRLERARPQHPEAWGVLNDLAWLRATCPDASVRNGAVAVEHAETLVADPARRTPSHLDTLAAAYAEAGAFARAVATMDEALGAADLPAELRQRYLDRRARYQRRQTYRAE